MSVHRGTLRWGKSSAIKGSLSLIARLGEGGQATAVAFAKDAPQPPANELTADIYSGMKLEPRMCNL